MKRSIIALTAFCGVFFGAQTMASVNSLPNEINAAFAINTASLREEIRQSTRKELLQQWQNIRDQTTIPAPAENARKQQNQHSKTQ